MRVRLTESRSNLHRMHMKTASTLYSDQSLITRCLVPLSSSLLICFFGFVCQNIIWMSSWIFDWTSCNETYICCAAELLRRRMSIYNKEKIARVHKHSDCYCYADDIKYAEKRNVKEPTNIESATTEYLNNKTLYTHSNETKNKNSSIIGPGWSRTLAHFSFASFYH